MKASYYVRGEKLVNEPDGPLGLAFSEIESSQLMRSHFFFLFFPERKGAKIVHFCQHLVFMWFYTTEIQA